MSDKLLVTVVSILVSILLIVVPGINKKWLRLSGDTKARLSLAITIIAALIVAVPTCFKWAIIASGVSCPEPGMGLDALINYIIDLATTVALAAGTVFALYNLGLKPLAQLAGLIPSSDSAAFEDESTKAVEQG